MHELVGITARPRVRLREEDRASFRMAPAGVPPVTRPFRPTNAEERVQARAREHLVNLGSEVEQREPPAGGAQTLMKRDECSQLGAGKLCRRWKPASGKLGPDTGDSRIDLRAREDQYAVRGRAGNIAQPSSVECHVAWVTAPTRGGNARKAAIQPILYPMCILCRPPCEDKGAGGARALESTFRGGDAWGRTHSAILLALPGCHRTMNADRGPESNQLGAPRTVPETAG